MDKRDWLAKQVLDYLNNEMNDIHSKQDRIRNREVLALCRVFQLKIENVVEELEKLYKVK